MGKVVILVTEYNNNRNNNNNCNHFYAEYLQGVLNMTGTDLFVNKTHCAAAVRLVYT